MRYAIRPLVALVAATVLVAAPAAGQTEAMTTEQISALARQMEKDAERWLKDEPVETNYEEELDGAVYDEKSLEAIHEAIKEVASRDAKMYLAVQFFRPLLMAKKEIVRKSIPMVKAAQQYGSLKKLPEYSEAAKRRFEIPEYRQGGASPARMNVVAGVQRNRDNKRARELPIKKNNKLVTDLETICCKLQILADDPEEDKEVVEALQQAMRRKRKLFVNIYDALSQAAPKMSRERAEALYELVERLATENKYAYGKLKDYGNVILNPSGNSIFKKDNREVFMGVQLYELLNQLASVARKPALKVPPENDARAYHSIQAAKAHLRRRKHSSAQRALRRVFEGRYKIDRNSPLYEEAEKLKQLASGD